MNKTTFGQRLKFLRKQKGYTQKELGEMIGTSQASIFQWERDNHSPQLIMVMSLADVFGMTLDELVGR